MNKIDKATEKKIDTFFSNAELTGSEIVFDRFVEKFHDDMQAGLDGRDSAMPMYASYIKGDDHLLEVGKPIAVIDAGGTNLRVALIKLKEDYSLEISDFKKHAMPGIDREVSFDEFFRTIAEYALPVVKQSSRVGFCFSYPMRKESAFDGTLKAWSKEVKAPGVLNKPICENLKKALADLGCSDLHITIFNDTVSTLLAGRTFNPVREYDGYMGLIMGTGLNTAYLEKNENIKRLPGLPSGTQVINMESAMFNLYERGPIDAAFIAATENPEMNQLEKISSGGYLGSLWIEYLKTAARNGLFSEDAAPEILKIKPVQTSELDSFLRDPFGEHVVGKCLSRLCEDDYYICWKIGDRLLERAAKVVALVISSVVLWTGCGENPLKPVCICVDGSTFFKLKGYREKTEHYLKSYLEDEKSRWVELVSVDNAPLVGAVVAGLTN
ncbi:MAG: hypothetical protein JEY99_10915 [Spirochaetales bacterium]|nr:hypothetical protein [Spirochaetales bacterium]